MQGVCCLQYLMTCSSEIMKSIATILDDQEKYMFLKLRQQPIIIHLNIKVHFCGILYKIRLIVIVL